MQITGAGHCLPCIRYKQALLVYPVPQEFHQLLFLSKLFELRISLVKMDQIIKPALVPELLFNLLVNTLLLKEGKL